MEEPGRGISANKAVFLSCCLARLPASGGHALALTLGGELPWWETHWRHVAAGNSSNNRLVFCSRLGSVAGGLDSSLLARLGDEKEVDSDARVYNCFDLQQGSASASLGSFLTTTPFSSPFSMAGWRSLPPRTSTTDTRLASEGMNQPPGLVGAAEALRLVRSMLPSPLPEWCVPDEVEIGCVELRVRRAGDGAGPDCFFILCSEVLSANIMGWFVIPNFYVALYVSCNSSVDF